MAKLLFVVNNPAFFLSHRLPIARAAKAAGYEVHVATPEGAGAEKIRRDFFFHPFRLQRGGRAFWGELRTIVALARVFKEVRPDIVHTVTIKPVLYGGMLSRVLGVPANVSAVSGLGYVFIAQGPVATLRRALVRAAYRVALGHPNGRVIFQNKDDLALFRAKHAVLIRGSGVDLDAFALAPPAERAIVMLPCRLLWDKGVGEFVAAARSLAGRASFVLVGEVDTENPAGVPAAQIEAWVGEGVVEWWGFSADMPATLARAAIVVLPSYREGLPKVLLEAAAVGRAIVTTDVPGCRDAVVANKTALLVPARDAAALAKAIATLLDDSALRTRFAAAGRDWVERHFSAERVAEQTLALYKELLP